MCSNLSKFKGFVPFSREVKINTRPVQIIATAKGQDAFILIAYTTTQHTPEKGIMCYNFSFLV
jgi:hypothetical protein